jgi:hypothetical protein
MRNAQFMTHAEAGLALAAARLRASCAKQVGTCHRLGYTSDRANALVG